MSHNQFYDAMEVEAEKQKARIKAKAHPATKKEIEDYIKGYRAGLLKAFSMLEEAGVIQTKGN